MDNLNQFKIEHLEKLLKKMNTGIVIGKEKEVKTMSDSATILLSEVYQSKKHDLRSGEFDKLIKSINDKIKPIVKNIEQRVESSFTQNDFKAHREWLISLDKMSNHIRRLDDVLSRRSRERRSMTGLPQFKGDSKLLKLIHQIEQDIANS